MADSAPVDAQNPWPGLAAFTEADRAFFRGRESEADELARLVRRERLTVLFGRSGLGKSSLLNAGLFPRLRDELHLPVLVRVGYAAGVAPRRQVWDALAAACAAAGVEAAPATPDESLWAYFHRADGGFWNRRRRAVLPVLVFDQFEELFTLGQADEASRAAAAGFIEELADLVENRPSERLRRELDADPARGAALDFERRGCKVLLSFREDFLAEVEGLRTRMPAVMRNRFRLLPMDIAQARAVIAAGGDLAGADVAERIVGLAWRNRAEPPTPEEAPQVEVDPALLSVICSELNQRRRSAGADRIAPALLARAETEILADFYERSLQGLDPAVRRFVEDELITAAGYRDSFAFDDALARPGLTAEALQRLVGGRLLRIDERFGARRLELTHDVLTRVVKESRDRRRAREAEAAALALEREAALRQQRARRRERLAWAGAAAALVLLLGAIASGYWAVVRDREARASAALAVKEREAGQLARGQADTARTQADTARGLADTARREADDAASAAAQASARAASSLEQAEIASRSAELQAARAQQTERDALATDLIVAARSTPADAPQLALLLGAEAVRRYPERLDGQVEQLARLVAAHRVRRLLEFDAPVLASAATRDGAHVLVATQRGELALVDTRSAAVAGRWSLEGADLRQIELRTSADARLALADIDSTPQLLRLVPGQPLRAQKVGGHGGGRYLTLSADGRRLAESNPAWPEVKLYAVVDGVADESPQRIALPRLAEFRCLSLDAAPGRLVIGTAAETHSVNLADGRVDTRPLPAPALAHSPDCSKALVRDTAEDGATRFRTFDIRSGTPLRVLREISATQPRPPIADPVFVADGRYVTARYADGAELWPVEDDAGRHWPSELLPDLVAASADGRWLAYGVPGDQIELRRVAEGGSITRFRLPQMPAAMHFAADGSSLVALGRNLLQVVRLEDARALKRQQLPFRADQIEFSGDGSYVGAGPHNGVGGLALWDLASGRAEALDARFSRIEFDVAGHRMVSYDRSESPPRVRVFDLRPQLRQTAEIAMSGQTLAGEIALDGAGRRLAIALPDGILVRDLHDAAFHRRIALPEWHAVKMAFHPREGWLAAVLEDGSVHAFGMPDGHERWTLASDRAQRQTDATAVAFSSDGQWLLVGRRSGTLTLHDPRSGAQRVALAPPRERAAPATNLVFIEGTTIVSAGGLSGAKDFWDLATRRWLGSVGADPRVRGGAEGADLKAVAVSARGRRIALKHADDTVSLHGWDPDTLVRDACAMAGRNLGCNEWRRYLREEPYRATCATLPPPQPACTPTR